VGGAVPHHWVVLMGSHGWLCWILSRADCVIVQALTAIRSLVESGVLRELKDVFEMADAWLAPHRP